jgi:serine/threonine protein kinase
MKKMEEENQNKTPQQVWDEYNHGRPVTRTTFEDYKKWCKEDHREPASTKSILAFYAKDRKDLLEHKDFTYDPASNAIGKGAFGEVYKAQKGITYFALKFPGTENPNNDALKNEMELMKGLNHPNIVRYYGYTINDQGHMGIVLDYLDGGSLYDHLHNSNPPPVWTVEEKKKGVLQLISALRELHGIDFVHRDLKSANILLKSGSLDLYLCDFGMTLKKDEDSEGNYRPEKAGTPLYKAPELLHSGIPPREIDRWKCADVYALCSVNGNCHWQATTRVPDRAVRSQRSSSEWRTTFRKGAFE